MLLPVLLALHLFGVYGLGGLGEAVQKLRADVIKKVDIRPNGGINVLSIDRSSSESISLAEDFAQLTGRRRRRRGRRRQDSRRRRGRRRRSRRRASRRRRQNLKHCQFTRNDDSDADCFGAGHCVHESNDEWECHKGAFLRFMCHQCYLHESDIFTASSMENCMHVTYNEQQVLKLGKEGECRRRRSRRRRDSRRRSENDCYHPGVLSNGGFHFHPDCDTGDTAEDGGAMCKCLKTMTSDTKINSVSDLEHRMCEKCDGLCDAFRKYALDCKDSLLARNRSGSFVHKDGQRQIVTRRGDEATGATESVHLTDSAIGKCTA